MKQHHLFSTPALVLLSLLLPATGGSAQESVATIDGTAISLADLEQSVAGELLKLEQQRHQVLELGLEQLVEQRLLEAEATRRGVPAEALLAKQIESGVQVVTDAEVETWYTQNQARLRGEKEQLLPQIRTFLEQQQSQQIRAEYLKQLRATHEVAILFEPLRIELGLEDATVVGAAGASVTIVEFSDFQCPACRRFNPTLTQVKAKYGDEVRVAFRQYPLRQIHPQAQKAAEAALCAREQGKFWELHDAMFGNQSELAVDKLKQRAHQLGLDAERFDQCLDSGQYIEAVQEDLERGNRAGVTGTPAVFVNGRAVHPGQVPTLEQIATIIDDELARARR